MRTRPVATPPATVLPPKLTMAAYQVSFEPVALYLHAQIVAAPANPPSQHSGGNQEHSRCP
ncbi:hypothetical protein SBA4_4820014 [Candidatus Sulfopaludibacter sp. SbA4]|nr:hypothetical protein SBA4_4820014 [Candidatus Sulfopaludibacter sp. SbA4]